MSGVAKREMAAIGSMSIEWTTMDIGHKSMVVCYDLSVPFELTNLDLVYISSRIPFPCKHVFKGELYPKFVSFCYMNT